MPTPRATSSRRSAKYAYAYTYRDYVVKAFNDDLPYDQFVVQQLAADRLVAAKQAPASAQAAMGFLTLGRRFLNNVPDIIDDRIDVVIARPDGADRGLRPLPRSQVRSRSRRRITIRCTAFSRAASSPRICRSSRSRRQTKEYLAFQDGSRSWSRRSRNFAPRTRRSCDAKNREFRDEARRRCRKRWTLTRPAPPVRRRVR